MPEHEFHKLAGSKSVCEIHLVTYSKWYMFSAEYGYCGSKARWWYRSYALCNSHKRALEVVLKNV